MAIKPTNNYFTDFEDTGLFGGNGSLVADMFVDIVPELAPMTTAAVAAASQPTPVAAPIVQAPANPTMDDLIQAYQQQGATTTTSYETEQGTQYNTTPNELAGGWMAWEKPAPVIGSEGQGMDATPIYGDAELGGFSKKEGDYVNFYDLSGNLVDRQKWNESALTSAWNDLGPVAMAALTMGGGAGMLGNALFGLEGAAAAAAGGAVGGGVNAAITDQNILEGALKGGLSSGVAEYLKPVSSVADADLAGGLIPEYGTNTAYDQFMASAMTPEASTAIADLINTQQPAVTVTPVVEAPPAYYEPTAAATPTAPSTAGYYNEITGEFVPDLLGGLQEPLTNATSGTNAVSMAGYAYDPATGDWTLPTGEVIPTTINPNPVTNGAEIMQNAGAMPATAVPVTPESKGFLEGLSPIQAANLLQGALGLFGALSAGSALGGGGGSTAPMVGALPTQGIPLNSQDYFNAIQQNYNTLLPALPRDVATPLSQWYNTQYTGT